MEIIRHREDKKATECRIAATRNGELKYCFYGDASGKPTFQTDKARKNYEQCLTGKDYDGTELTLTTETYEATWTEPAVGRCSCGAEVVLEDFTNTCDKCGADYNRSGQLLAPREQWGEETGESLSDILNIQ